MAITPVGGGGAAQGPNKLQQVQQQLSQLKKEDKNKIKQQLDAEAQAAQAGGAGQAPAQPQQAGGKADPKVQKVQQDVNALKPEEKEVVRQQLDQEDKVTQSPEAQQAQQGGDNGGGGDDAGSKIGDMIGNITNAISGMAGKGAETGGSSTGSAAPKVESTTKAAPITTGKK